LIVERNKTRKENLNGNNKNDLLFNKKSLCEMVTLMPCSYLSAPRCSAAGLIEKMIEIEPKVLKQLKPKLFHY